MCFVVVCATRFGITTRAEFKLRYDLTESKIAAKQATRHSGEKGTAVVTYGFPALSTLVSSSSGLLYLTPSTRGSRVGRAVWVRELDAALQIQIVRRACGCRVRRAALRRLDAWDRSGGRLRVACLFSIETVSSGCKRREQEGFTIVPLDGNQMMVSARRCCWG